MSYDYKTQRSNIFTEDGMIMLLKMRDAAKRLIGQAGAVRMAEIMITGDTWDMMACADYMVERDELREVTGSNVMGQHRVFVAGANL